MRQAINNNPIAQVAVLGGLALLAAVFFMTSMKGKGSSELRVHRLPGGSARRRPRLRRTGAWVDELRPPPPRLPLPAR